MLLKKFKKRRALVFPFKEINDQTKVSQNQNQDLTKISKVTITDNFSKVRKMTNSTCPKFKKVARNLFDFDVNKQTFYFMTK